MGIIYFIWMATYLWGKASPQYPAPEPRTVIAATDILSSSSLKPTGQKLPPYSVIQPCIFMKNGRPVQQGQDVLVGVEKVIFRDPGGSGDVGESLSAIAIEEDRQFRARQRGSDAVAAARSASSAHTVVSAQCSSHVTQLVRLDKTTANSYSVKLAPSPSLESVTETALRAAKKKDAANCALAFGNPQEGTPLWYIWKFQNSDLCLKAELAVGGRKKAYLSAWQEFIQKEQESGNPAATRAVLNRAQEIDVASRTALYEGNHEEGCSAGGICEKDIVLTTLRNRANDPDCKKKGYGCRTVGDVTGVSTTETQYNIWSDFFADITHMTSCFARADRFPGGQTSFPAQWPSAAEKDSYQRSARAYALTAQRAAQILYASDSELRGFFAAKGADFDVILGLTNYYHPPAMGKCYPNYPNLQFLSEGYVDCGGGQYFFLRLENLITQGPATRGRVKFKILNENSQGTVTPDDDTVTLEDRYPGCTVDERLLKESAPPKNCSRFGLPRQLASRSSECHDSPREYYRKFPSWGDRGKIPIITCNGVPSQGKSCSENPQDSSASIGGPCYRYMVPVANVGST